MNKIGFHCCPKCGNSQITEHEYCLECGYDFVQVRQNEEMVRFKEHLKNKLSDEEIDELINEFDLFSRY